MKKVFLLSALMLIMGLVSAQDNNLVEIAKNSGNHTILVRAIVAADLATTLEDKGPFTVFAPTNDAFSKLPKGVLSKLLEEENKNKLRALLKYHVIAGKIDAAAVMAAIKEGKDKAVLTTVQGETLTIMLEDGKVVIVDATGNKATVTATDLNGSNGVIHVIDTVLMPKEKKK
ncbi:fasciclin domain-containing protein [Cryomorphaceae bacterium 1068]|nr:fasciclin domain-containing protein [Cryomorphaceae bacterium 1068]